jgi:hypothetical protein
VLNSAFIVETPGPVIYELIILYNVEVSITIDVDNEDTPEFIVLRLLIKLAPNIYAIFAENVLNTVSDVVDKLV